MNKIKVVELFAGVGGFRCGLAAANTVDFRYETVWSSQWEPGAATQHASEIYRYVFGPENHSCEDIQQVIEKKFEEIPNHNLLVGGFPCQDYSVARTLNQAKGLIGKKGVLWWAIYNILKGKGGKAPDFLMLENVDRLLKSPSSQRGRDFCIMLASLNELGYAVEWRIINAADYGMPQRRRRVYIMGYRKNSKIYKRLMKTSVRNWIYSEGVIAKAFPIKKETDSRIKEKKIQGGLSDISEEFASDKPSKSFFENSGVMLDGNMFTVQVIPDYKGKITCLKDIIVTDEKKIPEEYFIDENDKNVMEKWVTLKGAKNEPRKSKSGHVYNYSEGAMAFPDPIDKPSRTIVTGEGGSSPSRFKHVIKTKSGRLRRLLPEELERLNMFPLNHTKYMLDKKITPDVKRAFIMGNALVVGVIERLGKSLKESND